MLSSVVIYLSALYCYLHKLFALFQVTAAPHHFGFVFEKGSQRNPAYDYREVIIFKDVGEKISNIDFSWDFYYLKLMG